MAVEQHGPLRHMLSPGGRCFTFNANGPAESVEIFEERAGTQFVVGSGPALRPQPMATTEEMARQLSSSSPWLGKVTQRWLVSQIFQADPELANLLQPRNGTFEEERRPSLLPTCEMLSLGSAGFSAVRLAVT